MKIKKTETAFNQGEYKLVRQLIDELINAGTLDSLQENNLIIKKEITYRIEKDFRLSEGEIKEKLKKYLPDLTPAQIAQWEKNKKLEMKIIEGEKRYFKNAFSNLLRKDSTLKKAYEAVEGKAETSSVENFKNRYITDIKDIENFHGIAFDKRKIKFHYRLKLKENAVPSGKIVKAWLPYPRIHPVRQPSVKLISANTTKYIIAPESSLQRTIFMEKEVKNNEETVFEYSAIIEIAAQRYLFDSIEYVPYDKSTELYRNFTKEVPPHIVFTDTITKLAQSIVGKEKNPIEQVRKLYYWLDKNIPWASALEYSTFDCIPMYVLENNKGDCGMQTFLFLSMARSLGIPCKWQSGWYLAPEEINLHDWAEVYFEGTGWVPVDISFKLAEFENKTMKEFYLGGMDSYHLIINDDFAKELIPVKKYFRSEPIDFQRGELEWENGNLYFDNWNYSMEVEYFDVE